MWDGKYGNLCCGYAGWTGWEPAAGESVNAILADPSKINANAIKALESMKAADWQNFAEGIFEFLGGPAELDDVVAVATTLFRVKDQPREAPEPPTGPVRTVGCRGRRRSSGSGTAYRTLSITRSWRSC